VSAGPLYTPEMLAAAVSLAQFPLAPGLPLRGQARSRSCGSSLTLGLAVAGDGRIAAAGCSAKACAVGQAAAALFLHAAAGRDRASIAAARAALAAWLAGAGAMPDWPGLALLAPARRHRGRHAAIVLAWDAALAALDADRLAPGAAAG